MKTSIPLAALLPLLTPYMASLASAQASGTGGTTRYWDCCKPSCAWPANAPGTDNPVGTCDINDNPLQDGGSTTSGCEEGGSAYMCSSHGPWAVSEDLAYGWAAVRIAGGDEASWCCACYELTFTSGPVAGKKMVVQATNTGGDLGDNHFDLAVSFCSFPFSPLNFLSVLHRFHVPIMFGETPIIAQLVTEGSLPWSVL